MHADINGDLKKTNDVKKGIDLAIKHEWESRDKLILELQKDNKKLRIKISNIEKYVNSGFNGDYPRKISPDPEGIIYNTVALIVNKIHRSLVKILNDNESKL